MSIGKYGTPIFSNLSLAAFPLSTSAATAATRVPVIVSAESRLADRVEYASRFGQRVGYPLSRRSKVVPCSKGVFAVHEMRIPCPLTPITVFG